jgi:hypothetical protein
MTPLACVIFTLTFALVSVPDLLRAQSSPRDSSSECSQPTAERDAIIREAEKDQYTTRRVEFIGNRYVRDAMLRSRTNLGLQEGELFTRWNLVRSLRNVSTLKRIYPVRMNDVELQLNRNDKTIDMVICFRERRTPKPGT